MKKVIIISAIAISGLFYNSANAQVRIHVGLNFEPRPVYVPERVVVQEPAVAYTEPANYDGDEDYYYIPEVDAYYSVPEECYYYNDGGRWVSAAYLPGAYRDFDWHNARIYEVRAHRPFMHNDYYRTRYNGVAFNGNWNRGYNRIYANDSRYNHYNQDQYRRDNRVFNDNRGWGGNNNRQYSNNNWRGDNRRNDQGRDRYMGGQHLAQGGGFQRNDRGDRENHRQGRF